MRSLKIASLLIVAFVSAAHAGKGKGQDLQAREFAGEAALEECLDDEARLTMVDSAAPAGMRRVSRGLAVAKVKDALRALSFIGPKTYDLGERGNPDHPEYDLYDHAMWQAVIKFKVDQGLVPSTWGDVGPGTMRRLDELFRKAAPPPLPPRPAPRPSDNDVLDRLKRALPAIQTAGPRRRVGCMIDLLRDRTVADGYPDYWGFNRTMPAPKDWYKYTFPQMAAIIAGNMRHVMKDFRQIDLNPTDAERASAMDNLDANIGTIIHNYNKLITQQEVLDGRLVNMYDRIWNEMIGKWQTNPRHVLWCYRDYEHRNREQ